MHIIQGETSDWNLGRGVSSVARIGVVLADGDSLARNAGEGNILESHVFDTTGGASDSFDTDT